MIWGERNRFLNYGNDLLFLNFSSFTRLLEKKSKKEYSIEVDIAVKLLDGAMGWVSE